MQPILRAKGILQSQTKILILFVLYYHNNVFFVNIVLQKIWE